MGRAPCCDKANVKKGPWSPEEDAKLKSYIEKFGTGGNWIALPQKIGLKRCGKSCRLRWLNYLRPNIKHGGFSEEEESIICNLYRSIGSRWSLIAAQLPGRTDNDIKNYWNTRLKKKLLLQVQSANKNQKPISNNPKQEEDTTIKWEYCEEDNTFIISNSLFFQPPMMSSSSIPIPLPSDDQEAATGNYLEQTILLSNDLHHHHNQSVQSSEDNVGISSMLLPSHCGFDFPDPCYYNNNLIAPDDQCHQEADVGYKNNNNLCRSWDNIGLSESFSMVNNSRISPEIAAATTTAAASLEDIKSPTFFDFEIGKNGNQLLLPDCTSIIEEEPMPFGMMQQQTSSFFQVNQLQNWF